MARSKEAVISKVTSKVRGTAKGAGPTGWHGDGQPTRALFNISHQYKKRMDSHTMQERTRDKLLIFATTWGWILRTLSPVTKKKKKKAYLKGYIHTVQFHVYKILKMTKL